MRWPKFTSWISWREKNASEANTQRLKWSKLLLDLVISETHTGLKRVTNMFALSDACKYSLSKVPYLGQEEKIDLTDQTWQLQKRNLKLVNCAASNLTHLFHLIQFVKC